jgi:glucose dehydrogenase
MADTRMIAFTPRRLCLLPIFASLLVLASSCSSKPSDPHPPQPRGARQISEPSGGARPGFEEAEDGQWLMPAKNYASTRFSGLDEINTGNVKNLKVAWTFSTGVNRGQEAAPIVVGDTMYVVTPYPNILYALDLKNPGAMKWKYEPDPASAAQGVACCDVVNRGAAYADGKVFFNTLDNYTVAVDAATGKEVWKTHWGTSTRARR